VTPSLLILLMVGRNEAAPERNSRRSGFLLSAPRIEKRSTAMSSNSTFGHGHGHQIRRPDPHDLFDRLPKVWDSDVARDNLKDRGLSKEQIIALG